MKENQFFEKQTMSSWVKASIVSEYFPKTSKDIYILECTKQNKSPICKHRTFVVIYNHIQIKPENYWKSITTLIKHNRVSLNPILPCNAEQ